MKKTRKLISMLLALAMVLGLMQITVSADASVTVSATGGVQTVRILTTEISGDSADSYEYQWYHNVDDQENGEYTPIYLATGDTYTITPNDIATWIRCEVTPITDGVRGAAITSNKFHQDDGYRTWRIANGGPGESKDNPSTYFVEIGNESLLILDEYEDSFYAITAGFKGWHTFGNASTNLFDPTDSSNIGYYLNNDLLTTTNTNRIGVGLQSYLINKKWWVGPGNDQQRSPYSFNAKVSLLSVEEYEKYKERIGWAPYGATANWWLRNTRGWTAGPNINTVSYSNNGQANGADTGEKSLLVRPTFFVDSNIFLHEKAKVSNMGSGIKEMLVRRYTAEQLKGAGYTNDELATIGFDVPAAAISASGSQDCLITLSLNITGITADSYEYQWYHNVNNEENGTYVPIYNATGETYMLSANDIETWIKCEVTPITNGVRGETITSGKYHQEASYKLFRVSSVGASDSENNPGTNYVHIASESILILDEYADSFYAITDGFKGWHAFGDASTYLFDPTNSSNIGYWLNNDFLTNNNISAAMQPYLINKKWWVGGGCDKAKSPYSFNAKVSLLSVDEYAKYHDKIGWGPHSPTGDWWLRNSRGWTAGPNINVVMINLDPSKKGQTGGARTGENSCLVRPTFYLDSDIFLHQKANVASMGSAVKRMLLRRYTKEDLEDLYTDQELMAIGYEVNCAMLSSSTNPPKALSTLTANYTDENAVSYEYEWYLSNDGTNFYKAISETAQTYVVSNFNMNKYIKAVVTAVYQDGTKGEPAETDTIQITELGRLSRTGYSDDREDNRENPEANYVRLAGEGMLILDEFGDTTESFYVISSKVKGRKAFDTDNTTKFDPTDSNNIAYTINNSLLNGTFTDSDVAYGIANAVQDYIPTHTWWTEAGASSSASPADYSVSAKIGLLSRSEYEKYWGKFGWDPLGNISGFWLRTGRGTGGTANTVFVAIGTVGSNYDKAGQNDWANTWDKAANSSGYYIRPTYYLEEDVFRYVKADVESMGDDVKAMLVRRYDKSELQGLYTETELEEIGFPTDISITGQYRDIYTKAEAFATINYTAQDMGDITVAYTNGTVGDSVTEFMYPDDVYQDTIAFSKLPYGENDVVITITDELGNVLSEANQKMYIVPDQPAVNIRNSGIAFHIDDWLGNRNALALVKKLGFTRVRVDFPWESIESDQGYNFKRIDSFVNEADRLGIRITPILAYNNSCYQDDAESSSYSKAAVNTDGEIAAFLNYAEAVAERYPQITEFEVWNEPNNPTLWSGTANVSQYSALVEATATRLYEVNPKIRVYAGAIDVSKDAVNFATSMFGNGLYDDMDALSIHPYFSSSLTNFENRLSEFRTIILNNGGFKKLAATEFGFNVSSSDANPDVTRAQEAVKAIVDADEYNVGDLFLYSIANDKYGILTEDFEVNATLYPMAYLNSVLADTRFVGKITSGTLSKYVYIKPDGSEVTVCWSTSSNTYTLLSGEKAYDMNGNAISGSTISISSAPIYIFGTSNANGAQRTEINARKSAITSKYSKITSAMLSAANAKEQIMAISSLSAKDKATALYMLHEIKKIEAVYASLTNTSDLTVPTVKLSAVDTGNNIYSAAALKMAAEYVDECKEIQSMSFAGKNSILASDIMIANDLIESAKLLSPSTTPAIKDVAVNNGQLTFSIKNVEDADVWVATYSNGLLTAIQKVARENLSCEVGAGSGKIFVWDGFEALAPEASFGN